MIIMDFIIELPGNDNMLIIVIDKFLKVVRLIPGRFINDAEAWAKRLLDFLWSHNWGISRALISDCDPKFTLMF